MYIYVLLLTGFYRDEVGFYKWSNGKQGVEQNGVWASGQPTVFQSGDNLSFKMLEIPITNIKIV